MVLTRRGARAAVAKEKDRPFRILDLPPELVQAVFHLFTDDDKLTLCTIRLVCRAFKDHSLTAFGTTFFDQVVAILHPLSLSILLEIANHPELSKFVRRITISGEQIGGVIGECGQPDERKMKDLQKSMERSGLDQMILTAVFWRLPKVETVRIDNESYHCDTEIMDAARCGSMYIFTGRKNYDLESAQRGSNRAFSVVFTCLRNAGLFRKVNLEIEAHVLTMASQNDTLFNPTSWEWKHYFAGNVNSLELSGELGSRWTLDMLQSVKNLLSLEVFIAEELFELSHPTTGLFIWPYLYRLKLDHVNWHAQSIIDFLDAHKGSLCDIHLQMFDLVSGSWRKPFEIMLGMPRLGSMFLSALSETTVPPNAGLSFDRFCDFTPWDSHYLELEDTAEIRIALEAILHDFRTTDHNHIAGYNDLLMFRLDFRLARAVLDGRAEISEGECHLLV